MRWKSADITWNVRKTASTIAAHRSVKRTCQTAEADSSAGCRSDMTLAKSNTSPERAKQTNMANSYTLVPDAAGRDCLNAANATKIRGCRWAMNAVARGVALKDASIMELRLRIVVAKP